MCHLLQLGMPVSESFVAEAHGLLDRGDGVDEIAQFEEEGRQWCHALRERCCLLIKVIWRA